jgi:hypothetical protein
MQLVEVSQITIQQKLWKSQLVASFITGFITI